MSKGEAITLSKAHVEPGYEAHLTT